MTNNQSIFGETCKIRAWGGDFWQELNIFVSSDFNINQLASLQIYNMKQPSLSLTFPLFYLSSSPPKAKLQCFHVFRQVGISENE